MSYPVVLICYECPKRLEIRCAKGLWEIHERLTPAQPVNIVMKVEWLDVPLFSFKFCHCTWQSVLSIQDCWINLEFYCVRLNLQWFGVLGEFHVEYLARREWGDVVTLVDVPDVDVDSTLPPYFLFSSMEWVQIENAIHTSWPWQSL